MPLPSSGPISFATIAQEFGDTAPHSLSEFYRGGGRVPNIANNNSVPTSGAIGIGSFYNTVGELVYTVSSNTTLLNLESLITTTNWTANIRKRVIIQSGVIIGSTSVSSPALLIPSGLSNVLTIENYGEIQGAGGAAGSTGGDAIAANSLATIINHSSGKIYAGGGGGGTGGAGGKGGDGNYAVQNPDYYAPPAYLCAGSVTTCAAFRCSPAASFAYCTSVTGGRFNVYGYTLYSGGFTYYSTTGGAGGAGGAGGVGRGYNQALASGSTGAAGSAGGTNAGTGGTGGTGGSGGDWGQSGSTGSTGGVGANGNVTNGLTGAAGVAGGLAGFYINGLSTYVTLTNNGTVAGRTN